MNDILPVTEAARRAAADRGLLLDKATAVSPAELLEPYRVGGDPLGDFCDSLRDLVAHVLMWDEINLAVLAEARRGRRHWSLETAWESPTVGARLNEAGVAAGRLVPADLLVQRFAVTRDALLDELASLGEEHWRAATPLGRSMGELAQYVWTVPNRTPFWHAAIHLRELDLISSGSGC